MARASGFFGLLFLYDLKDILDAAIQGSNDPTKGRTVIANHPIFIIMVIPFSQPGPRPENRTVELIK